ncbi:MAG: hypothetical protein ACON3Z_11510 [Bradymonadia bacterium]
MLKLRCLSLWAVCVLLLPLTAIAEPGDDVRALLTEATKLEKRAKRQRAKQKAKGLIKAATKLARAHALLTANKLDKSMPELRKQVDEALANMAKRDEIVSEIKAAQERALKASVEGRLTEAYDHFAKLKDLSPKDPNIEYILGVIGQRMEAPK